MVVTFSSLLLCIKCEFMCIKNIIYEEAYPALGHKGHLSLVIISGWVYDPSKYAPDEIRNSLFLPLMKKAEKICP